MALTHSKKKFQIQVMFITSSEVIYKVICKVIDGLKEKKISDILLQKSVK